MSHTQTEVLSSVWYECVADEEVEAGEVGDRPDALKAQSSQHTAANHLHGVEQQHDAGDGEHLAHCLYHRLVVTEDKAHLLAGQHQDDGHRRLSEQTDADGHSSSLLGERRLPGP